MMTDRWVMLLCAEQLVGGTLQDLEKPTVSRDNAHRSTEGVSIQCPFGSLLLVDGLDDRSHSHCMERATTTGMFT